MEIKIYCNSSCICFTWTAFLSIFNNNYVEKLVILMYT